MQEEDIRCPICLGETYNIFYGVHRCKKCRHIYDITLPPDIRGSCYEKSRNAYDYRPEILSDVERMGKRWELVLRHAKGCKSLLDYGCANNHFIKCAPPEHGFKELVGFDTTWLTGFSDERKLDRSYDVMTMWHSLEHIQDPKRVLERFPHKYLFVIIPWVEYLEDNELASCMIFNPGRHFNLYTRESFKIVSSGYEILEENYEDGTAIGWDKHCVGFAMRKL